VRQDTRGQRAPPSAHRPARTAQRAALSARGMPGEARTAVVGACGRHMVGRLGHVDDPRPAREVRRQVFGHLYPRFLLVGLELCERALGHRRAARSRLRLALGRDAQRARRLGLRGPAPVRRGRRRAARLRIGLEPAARRHGRRRHGLLRRRRHGLLRREARGHWRRRRRRPGSRPGTQPTDIRSAGRACERSTPHPARGRTHAGDTDMDCMFKPPPPLSSGSRKTSPST